MPRELARMASMWRQNGIRAFMAAMFGFTFFPVGDPKKSLHIYIYIYGTH